MRLAQDLAVIVHIVRIKKIIHHVSVQDAEVG